MLGGLDDADVAAMLSREGGAEVLEWEAADLGERLAALRAALPARADVREAVLEEPRLLSWDPARLREAQAALQNAYPRTDFEALWMERPDVLAIVCGDMLEAEADCAAGLHCGKEGVAAIDPWLLQWLNGSLGAR